MPTMRAKMQVQSVTQYVYPGEKIEMSCVTSKRYDDTGLDEDNTFAKFSPSGSLQIHVQNPALFGVIKAGQTFYLDFTLAEDK